MEGRERASGVLDIEEPGRTEAPHVEHEDDVARAAADHLVRDVQASAARTPCPRSRH
jgi:hypothetical protein